MRERSNLIQIKRKAIFCFAVILIALISVTPVLADYLGPHRTVTETTSACKVILYECQYVTAKDTWKYKQENSWSCSNEGKPWQEYSSNAHTCTDTNHTAGYQYWEREDVPQTATKTYPPATIDSSLQNCMLQNGWCVTPPQLFLNGIEPVAGHYIFAIEGSLNGQTFACMNSSCSVPLTQGNNSLAYWALSSFGDSSSMGTLTAYVDSQPPNIAGAFTGLSGSNGWYVGPVAFNGSASDVTSGLESFTCTLDGAALGSCNTIAVNSEGLHTLVLTARDNAGLMRTLTQNASIDTQNPALNASINGTLGSNNWYTTATLNASASDPSPGSGLALFEYNFDGASWTTFPSSGTLNLSEGKHSVNVRVIDQAGHTVSSSKSFWLDTSAPRITVDSDGTKGTSDWYTTTPIITASANDDTSGMDVFEYSLDNSSWTAYVTPVTLGNGIHSLSFWAQDEAGLVKQVDRTYQVDTRVPQIAGSLNGVLGVNGWYISELTLSASASDPTPGSGLDTFTYTLNGNAEASYTDPLTLSDGQHTVQLRALDKAGLSHSIEQTIRVDTIHPSLKIESKLPNWVKDKVTLSGTVGDDGSGISKLEISTDGEQTWQGVTGSDSWSYVWNTLNNPNGSQQLNLRAIDLAGLMTQQTLTVGVDNRAPEISLPDSWFQWDTVTLDIWDSESGLSEAQVEIIDPTRRGPKRVIKLDPQQFPLGFKWDRRLGDNTVAAAGTYIVKVTALDSLGNTTEKNASIRIILDILPAGPTATLQPYIRAEATPTQIYTVTSVSSPTATQTAIVSVFGTIESTAQATPTPVVLPTPRPTPTQTGVLDWLQSIFMPNSNEESTTEIGSLDGANQPSQSAGTDNNVLWGTAAAAAIGSAMAYVQEEKRKREEEKARQAALDAEEEERREKKQERKMEKMEAKRAQEQAWQQAREGEEARRQKIQDDYLIQYDNKMARFEAEEDARIASQIEAKKKQAEEKKKAEELNERLRAYYSAPRQEEKETSTIQATNWWEKTKSFVSENVIQPISTYINQPYFKQPIEKTKEFIADTGNWINQRITQPAIERTKEFVANESAWIKENIYEPVVKPAIERNKEFLKNETTWINEKIYQPYIQPAVDRTKEFLASEGAWINEKIYQPYIQPALDRTKEFVASESAWINEEIYQPYIQPVVKVIDEKIYEPVFEPVVSDINQSIYKPLADKVSNWWDQYGEWVHGALDAAGVIPGFGEAADGINALIYLSEGRYLEAGISAVSMIPILGDLGKAGKLGLELAAEVAEEATEKVVKEVTEGLIENVAKEVLEETAEQVTEVALKEVGEELADKVVRESLEEVEEKVFKETGKEIVETTTKETFEEVAEKTIKEVREEVAEKISEEAAEKATKKVTNEAATKVTEDAVATISSVSIDKVSTVTAEDIVQETLEQASEEAAQLIISLRKQYGDEMVDTFLPFCENYGINPYDVLTRPPAEGQSLVGWGLGIENPLNPANHPLVNLNLTKEELNNILEKSTVRPDSKVVVLGYGKGSTKPYYILSDEVEGCHLSLSDEAWSPFDEARANFLVDINIPFIEKGIEDRKIFLFNINKNTVIDPLNAARFSLPELRLIELPSNNYMRFELEQYELFVPQELEESYLEHLPSKLLGELK